jgi:hypothetical protein
MTLPERYVDTPDEIEIGRTPDLVIIMDSDPRILDSADQYKEIAPVIVYGVDNHVRDYRRPHFDHYFLAHRDVSVMEWRDDMTWLPCAYDPTLFTPSPIPYAEREYDVCMIGVMYPQRWQLVSELRAAGLKVLAGTGLLFEDYRDAYHNARISLCISAAGDVAQRVFETAAMGCLVVSDPCADFERLGAAGVVKSYDFVQAVQGFLARPDMAQTNIALSMAWVKNETWDARAQVIIDWLQKRQAGEAFYATVE